MLPAFHDHVHVVLVEVYPWACRVTRTSCVRQLTGDIQDGLQTSQAVLTVIVASPLHSTPCAGAQTGARNSEVTRRYAASMASAMSWIALAT